MKETLATRIKSRAENLGISQNKLAEMIGIKQSSMANIYNGKTLRPKKLLEIAQALQVSQEWLLYGKDEHEREEPRFTTKEQTSNLDIINASPRDIPVYQSTSEDGKIKINREQLASKGLRVPIFENKEVFVLLISGHSMIPAYEVGDPVFVVDEEPRTGTDVLIELLDEDNFIFKRLKHEDDEFYYCQQFNPPRDDLKYPKENTKIYRVMSAKEVTKSFMKY